MIKKKIALITGITGQDGSYLAEFLLSKGYIVHGIKRRSSVLNTFNIDHLIDDNRIYNKKLFLHYGDLSDSSNLSKIILKIKPNEIYNLAAQSHVGASFDIPEYTADINALGCIRILEIIRNNKILKNTKYYQASTSELYGLVSKNIQNETTKFHPRSPYSISKLYAYWATINYRESYNIYACNGILFNHESKRRSVTFVTRKITYGLVRVLFSKQKYLILGNLDSRRDWGHSEDFVKMQWKILQQKKPKDYVISTGLQFSVRKFVEKCCLRLGFKIKWKGKGVNEIGFIDKIFNDNLYKIHIDQIIIKVDKKFFRPAEVDNLKGDSSLARKELNWKPRYNIDDIIDEMISNDLKEISS